MRFQGISPVVLNLLIINIIMYVVTFVIMTPEFMIGNLALYYFDSPYFKPFQVITHMFMHGGFTHILFNMIALWIFGPPLEKMYGPKRFLLLYLVAGLGAALVHQAYLGWQVYESTGSLVNDPDAIPMSAAMVYVTKTLGASGAVYGVMVAFAMLFPNTQLLLLFPPIPIKAKYFVLIMIAIGLYLGFSRNEGDNVAHFAHLGGALFGFIMVKIWQRSRRTFY